MSTFQWREQALLPFLIDFRSRKYRKVISNLRLKKCDVQHNMKKIGTNTLRLVCQTFES